jgi:hypothetical protein
MHKFLRQALTDLSGFSLADWLIITAGAIAIAAVKYWLRLI